MSDQQRHRPDERGDGRRAGVVVPFTRRPATTTAADPAAERAAGALDETRYYPLTAIARANLAHHAGQARAAWSAFLADRENRPSEAIRALQEWTRAREHYGELHGHTPQQIAHDLTVDAQDLDALDLELDRLCEWAGIDPEPLKTPSTTEHEAGQDQAALFDPPPPALHPVTADTADTAGDDDAAGW